jgi:DNA-binding SARP family transcriptional activator
MLSAHGGPVGRRVSPPDPGGLRRQRLLEALDRADHTGLGVVVAPLGSGKTTLLEQWAVNRIGPVRWVGRVGVNLDELSEVAGDARTVIIDDAHRISPHGMSMVTGLIEQSTPRTTFMVASRTLPAFNFAHRGFPTPELVTEDDLRFRPSEVVRLFREVYGTGITDEVSTELTTATDGWAAALHLYHLAERSLPARAKGPARTGSYGRGLLLNHPYTREYLTREVLDPLPPVLVHFLQMTSVFDTVTVRRCDLLLAWDGSRRALRELTERSGLVRPDRDDADTFQYHPVLRDHLRGQLGEVLGSVRGQELCERAAGIVQALAAQPAGAAAQGPAVRASGRSRPALWNAAPADAGLEVRCLGDFQLRIGGRDVDLSSVRPVARTVLRALAVNSGAALHREHLVELFWPHRSLEAGIHNLHVAVSSLRQCIETVAPGRSHGLLARCGAAYVLAPGAEFATDIQRVDARLRAAAQAATEGDEARQLVALRAAVEGYAGDILPEDGPAEWVVDVREQFRQRVAHGASELALIEVSRDHLRLAVLAARRSVELDPWNDEAWRRLIDCHVRAGDRAQAALARQTYRSRLSDLGVTVDESRAPSQGTGLRTF